MSLLDPDRNWIESEPCAGSGGFADIKDGAPVVVRDLAGKVLGTATLTMLGGDKRGACGFGFMVEPVPELDCYTVEVSGRSPLECTKERIEYQGGAIFIDLY